VLKMSLVSDAELFAVPPTWWPQSVSGASLTAFDCPLVAGVKVPCPENYYTVAIDPTFKAGLANTLVIAGITTIVCLVVGSMAAYALARVEFFAKRPVLSMVLAITFFPAVAIIAPLFLQFQTCGLINTYWGVIIPDVLFALPLTVYLLVAYFRELPADLEEAAKVDGANIWQAFFRITVPLSIPGIVTTGLLTFIFAWNEFLFANTLALDESVQPATVVIPQFATTYTTDYGAQAAASIVLTAPLVILVLFFQRKIVSGLTAGATTG
ncbi:MAG TPA: carbohydrate ABC transporter permease, partial [Actinomycetota bacterium]|nr:carbohydrate ABC transporter permease [Actinomycetota bacterium]